MSVAVFPVKLLPLHYPKRDPPILDLGSEVAVAQQLEFLLPVVVGMVVSVFHE